LVRGVTAHCLPSAVSPPPPNLPPAFVSNHVASVIGENDHAVTSVEVEGQRLRRGACLILCNSDPVRGTQYREGEML
jgi:hypothetical protein